MNEAQKDLLARMRLDLGAYLRTYFSCEQALDLREKLANLIRDEAGSDIKFQVLRPETKPYDDRNWEKWAKRRRLAHSQ